MEDVSRALLRLFDQVRGACDRDVRLGPLFERVHYPLVAMADQAILSSSWNQRTGWAMNLLETQVFGRAEGGKQFFREVEEVLNDPSESAPEVAEVLFQCLGLGFQGELLGERTELEKRRRQLYEKARLAGALGGQLCPDAYGRNAVQDLTKLPTVSTIRLVGVAAGALLFAGLVGRTFTSMATDGQREKIQAVTEAVRRGEPVPLDVLEGSADSQTGEESQ